MGKTPYEIGEIREKRPLDIAFLEYSMIHRWKTEYEARKKAEDEAKRKSRGKHIRRH